MEAPVGWVSPARRAVKKAVLPLLTWPTYQALRVVGFYRRPAEPPRARRTLVALYGGIGNVVLAGPMLRAVREGLPDSILHVWCESAPAAELCRAMARVDAVLVDGTDAVESGYDLFLANCVAPPLRASLLGLRSGAGLRVGEDQTRSHRGLLLNCPSWAGPEGHEVERNLAIAEAVGLEACQRVPFLDPRPEDHSAAMELLRDAGLADAPLVGLHPGSGPGQRFKRWGRCRFAELAERLCFERGLEVLVFGGPEEVALAEAVVGQAGCGHVLAGRLSLLQSAALIRRCRAFVSNDSGLMHISAAVGTPTVGIFGPTRPQKNRPYGHAHRVVAAGLPCQPCYDAEGRIRCRRRLPCLEAVEADHVLAAVDAVLGSAGAAERVESASAMG